MKKKSEDYDFGLGLEQMILKKFKTISAFAKVTGINKKTIDGWIGTGARFPSRPEYIKSMAEALNVSVHELLYGCMDNREPLAAIFEKTEIHTGTYELTIKKIIKKD